MYVADLVLLLLIPLCNLRELTAMRNDKKKRKPTTGTYKL